jgi:HK97 family phage major capsid protein
MPATTDLKALYDEKGNIVKDMRDLDAKLTGEKRRMNAEDKGKWDKWNSRLEDINEVIERSERLSKLESEADESRREFKPDSDGREQRRQDNPNTELRAVQSFEGVRRDAEALNPEDRKTIEGIQSRGFANFLMRGMRGLSDIETRALQMGSGPDGGYLVAPTQWIDKLIQKKDDQVFLRQWATKETISGAHSLGYPSLDTDVSDSDWTSELGTGSEDSSMKFGSREFKTNPLAKRIKISKTAMRNSSIEEKVLSRLAYKFAVTEEKAFLTGSGHNRPLGVFTASSDGISTTQDMATGNTTTAIGADNLFRVKYKLKGQYHPNAKWVFHRDAVLAIQLLKDSNNQYLWQPGLQAGVPDRILGIPFHMSEFAPNTFTTGLYVGILGDFSFYNIVDSLDMEIQRLTELYAESNQVGFIGRAETDGMPVLEEAFVRVTLA